ncbi:MAG: methyl-accepting chemotaxis protein [Treponema sp.]|jgi:methyl-accepting chemotaxis protein|nr:methyl-accepting chemotaxis protein [Treponema sp.]
MKLRKRLIVIFILISILPLLTGIGIILLQSSAAIRQNAQGVLSEYSVIVARDIEAFFMRKLGLVEATAFFPGLADMTWPEKKQALDPLGRKLARSDSINTYLYCNADGSYYRSDNPGNPALGGLVTGDNRDPAAAPNLLTTRDYFVRVVGTNAGGEHRSYISNPVLSKSTGQKFVMAASSVIGPSGAVAGMLGIYVEDHTMEALLDSLAIQIRRDFGERLFFFIIAENGTLLSHREFDPALGKYTERALNVNEDIALDSLPGPLRQALQGMAADSVLSYRNESGERCYMTGASVQGTGYRVVLSLPESTLYATIFNIERITLTVLAATIVVVLLLAVFFSARITSPLVATALTLRDISEGEGDLTKTVAVTSKDEIGDLAQRFNATLEKIKTLVIAIKNQTAALFAIGNELASNMTETAAAINQIAATIRSIKGRALAQSAGVAETNAAMEQITVTIDKLSGHVDRQGESVARSSNAIEEMLANIQSVAQTLIRNADSVKELTGASEAGRGGLEEVAADIQEIARESEGLLEINSVMQNIASQTNLLSMNAAIEAAHAGEAGKGFAVVANEIRKLAENSGEQSKTISAALKKIKDSIDKISKSTGDVLNKFEAIDSGVRTVSEQEERIRSAMEEQSAGSRQILEAMGQLQEATQLVKGGSAEMLEGSKRVIRESKSLETATEEIANGMNEMASGADQINVAVARVAAISGENRESIEALAKEVAKFKV